MSGDRETHTDQPSSQHLLTGTNVAVIQAKNNNRGSRDEPRFSRHIIGLLSVVIFILASVIGEMSKKILNIRVYTYSEFKILFFWQSSAVYLILDKFSANESSRSQCRKKEVNESRQAWDYYADKDYFYDENNSSLYSDDSSPWEMYHDIKPRCFSMCEPPELFFRDQTFISLK